MEEEVKEKKREKRKRYFLFVSVFIIIIVISTIAAFYSTGTYKETFLIDRTSNPITSFSGELDSKGGIQDTVNKVPVPYLTIKELDEKYPVQIDDPFSLQLKLKLPTNSLQIGQDIPTKIVTTNYNETSKKYYETIRNEANYKFLTDKDEFIIDLSELKGNEVFHYGPYSTEVALDYTELLADVRIDDAGGDRGTQVKWNTTQFLSSVIDDAEMCAWIDSWSSLDADARLERIDGDQVWDEASNAGTLDGQTLANTSAKDWSSTTADTWACINVTIMIRGCVDAGEGNCSIRFSDHDGAGYVDSVDGVGNFSWAMGNGGIQVTFDDRESSLGTGNRPGLNITHTVADIIAPVVNVTLPLPGTYTDLTFDVNYIVTDAGTLDKCWYTNDSGVTNATEVAAGENFSALSSSEEINKWDVYCNDTASNIGNGSVTITRDTINPDVNITFPLNTTYSVGIFDLNYTMSDANPETCWYSLDLGITNSTNQTASLNFTTIFAINGSNTWNVYCNDTVNNQNSSSVTFFVENVLTLNETFDLADVAIDDAGSDRGGQIKWDISDVPSGATIDDAQMCVDVDTWGASTSDVKLERIDGDQTWDESSNAGVLDGQTLANDTVKTWSSEVVNTSSCINMTTQIRGCTDASEQNCTFRFSLDGAGYVGDVSGVSDDAGLFMGNNQIQVKFNDREDSLGSGVLPKLFIEYTPAPLGDITPLDIGFVPPTQTTGFSTANSFYHFNVSINETLLQNVTLGLDSNNYTVYEDELFLMMNFDDFTRFNDTSSNANNGSCSACPTFTTSGRYNGAYDFDGSQDITIPEIIFNGNETITMWAKKDVASGTYLLAGKVGTDNYIGMVRGEFRVRDDGKKIKAWTYAFPIDTWVYIAVVMNDTDWELYIDGVSQGLRAVENSLILNTLGAGYHASRYEWDGTIDEVRIWNRTFDGDEINQSYAYNLNKFADGNWSLDVNYTTLNDATYTYYACATDTNSNENCTESRTFTLASSIPEVTAVRPEAKTYPAQEVPFNVTATDGGAGMDTCLYSVDSGLTNFTMANISTNPTMWNATNSTALSGNYTAIFYCNNTLNTIGTATVDFAVDINPPSISLESPIAFQNLSSGASVDFEYNPEPDGGTMDTCQLYLNTTGVWHLNQTDTTINNSITNTMTVTNIPNGTWKWNVFCNDTSDNSDWSQQGNFTFTIDSAVPGLVIDFPVQGTVYDSFIDAINFTVTEDFPETCLSTTNGWIDNVTLDDCVTNLTGLFSSEGANNWGISVNDSAGNINFTNVSFTVTLSEANYSVTIDYPLNGVEYFENVSSINLTIDFLDSPDIAQINYSQDGGITNISTCLFPTSNCSIGQNITDVIFAEGSNTVDVWVFNGTKFEKDSSTFTMTILSPNVTLQTPANQTITSNTTVNFTAEAEDPVGIKNATLFLYNSSNDLVNETSLTFTNMVTQITLGIVITILNDDIYHWYWEVINWFDKEGSSQDAVADGGSGENFTLTIDTTGPVIETPNNATLNWSDKLDVVFNATDLSSSIDTWVVNDTNNFVINSTGGLKNATILAIDEYIINVSVNDSLGNINSILYQVNVNNINTTIKSAEFKVDEFIFNSATYIPMVNGTFNLTRAEHVTFKGVAQASKTTGGSSELSMKLSINDIILFDAPVRTVSSINDKGVFNIPINDTIGIAGQNNISLEVKENGAGSINVSSLQIFMDVDVSFFDTEINHSHTSFSGVYSNTSFVNIANFTHEHEINSTTVIDVQHTFSTTASDTTPNCYLENNVTGEITPTYSRWLENSGDIGSSGINFISSIPTNDSEDWKLWCLSSDTINNNVTFYAFSLAEENTNTISAFQNQTSSVVATSGLNNNVLAFENYEVRNGTSIHLLATVIIQSTSGKQEGSNSPIIKVNTSSISEASCSDTYQRSLSSSLNNDIGTIKIYVNCNGTTIGDIIDFNVYVDVASGQTLNITNASLSGHEVTHLDITTGIVPPAVSIDVPVQGANVSGIIEINATVSDISGTGYFSNISILNGSFSFNISVRDDNGVNQNITNTTFDTTTLDDGFYVIEWVVENSIGSNFDRVNFTINNNPPNITLTTPTNQTITSNTSINFTANIADDSGIINATLYIYNETGLYNQTNISFVGGVTSTTVGIVVFLIDGIYHWFWEAVDFFGNIGSSQNATDDGGTGSNFTITIDSTNPIVNITFPLNTTYHTGVLDLNYTISDTNPDKCWFNNGFSNSSEVEAGINATTVFALINGSNTWTIYCNDTLGNENSSSVTFFAEDIVILNSTDDNLEDVSYDDGTPNDTGFQIKWDITDVPVSTIDEALMCLYIENADNPSDFDAYIWRIVNQSWTESSLNVSFDAHVETNLTTDNNWSSVDAGNYTCINVSTQIQGCVDVSETNCSIRVEDPDKNATRTIANIDDSPLWFGNISSEGLTFEAREDSLGTGNLPRLSIAYTLISPDATNPNVTINTPTDANYTTTTIDFNITALDETEMESCEYSLNAGILNFTMSNTTFVDDYNATNSSMIQGSTTINFYCNDTNNNLNDSESVNIFIDSIAPTFDNMDNKTQEANVTFSFDLDATDSGIGLGTFALNDTTNYTIDSSTGVITNVTALDYVFIHWLNVSINDSLGNTYYEDFWINITARTPGPEPCRNFKIRNKTSRAEVYDVNCEGNVTVYSDIVPSIDRIVSIGRGLSRILKGWFVEVDVEENYYINGTQGYTGDCINTSIKGGIIIGCND